MRGGGGRLWRDEFMTPESQRIAIAEACGLSEIGWMYETLMHAGTGTFLDVPEYLTDLNAMHEAEKALNHNMSAHYADQLCLLVGIDWNSDAEFDEFFKLSNATAAQRAEAFLKTIGKWTP